MRTFKRLTWTAALLATLSLIAVSCGQDSGATGLDASEARRIATEAAQSVVDAEGLSVDAANAAADAAAAEARAATSTAESARTELEAATKAAAEAMAAATTAQARAEAAEALASGSAGEIAAAQERLAEAEAALADAQSAAADAQSAADAAATDAMKAREEAASASQDAARNQQEAARLSSALARAQRPEGEKLTLTVGVPGEIETFDPCCANFIRSHESLLLIYEVPVIHPAVEKNGAMVADNFGLDPRYFESWEVAPDGVTYTIKIREGITFDDGSPINAEVARFMIDRNLNTPGGGAWLLENIAKVSKPPKVIDDYTIEITADQPSPLAMQSFYMTSSSAVDPKVVAKYATEDDPWATEHFSTTVENPSGPYRLLRSTPEEVVFEARLDFYLGPPAYDRVVWKIIPEPAVRVQLLMAGEIDVAIGLGTEEFAELEGAEGVQVLRAPSTNMAYLGMNNQTAPFTDKSVRQAVSYAVDYDDILENVYKGDARRLWGPLSEGTPTSLGDSVGYTQDVVRAKDLLDSSSYDGSTVPLYFSSARSEHEQIAVRVKAALSEIGMEVEIVPLTASVIADRKVTSEPDQELAFFVDEFLPWIADPSYTFDVGSKSGVFGNYVDFSNARVDELIDLGWKALDPEERRELSEEAQRIIVDEAPWVYLAQPDYKIAMRDTVTGFVLYPNEIPRLADLRPAE